MIVDLQGRMTLLIAGDLHSDLITDGGAQLLRGLESGN
jgi:hypothetical protein